MRKREQKLTHSLGIVAILTVALAAPLETFGDSATGKTNKTIHLDNDQYFHSGIAVPALTLSCKPVDSRTCNIYYTLDGTVPSRKNGTRGKTVKLGYGPGIYNLKALGIDNQGNVATDVMVHEFIWDASAPDVWVNRSNGTHEKRFELNISCDDDISGCRKIALSADGSDPDFNNPDHIYRRSILLPKGMSRFQVRAMDAAGNVSKTKTVNHSILSDETESRHQMIFQTDLAHYLTDLSASNVDQIASKFIGYDLDQDGYAEIANISRLRTGFQGSIPGKGKLLLILVERQLLERAKALASDGKLSLLVEKINRLEDDTRRDGFSPRILVIDLPRDSERHQDGLTLLGLRRMLQAYKASFPAFRGVLMLGEFPEATLVLRHALKRKARDMEINGKSYPLSNKLTLQPTPYAVRSNIVLEDLDGNWEKIYILDESEIEGVRAVHQSERDFPNEGRTRFRSFDYEIHREVYEDFFFIDDTDLVRRPGIYMGLDLGIDWNPKHPELAEGDHRPRFPTKLASPEIKVSRISARKVALSPPADLVDSSGRPVADVLDDDTEANLSSWQLDTPLEITLINDYLDRNHNHRTNRNLARRSLALIVGPDDLGFLDNSLADSGMADGPRVGKPGDILAYVDFLGGSDLLKGITAHSSGLSSTFPSPTVADGALEQKITRPENRSSLFEWSVTQTPEERWLYTPSFSGSQETKNKATFKLYRTLYTNQILPKEMGFFYLHNGCNLMTPPDGIFLPYSDEQYGRGQNADAILFLANGLTVTGRSKTHSDSPWEFGRMLGDGKTVGHALQRYNFHTKSKRDVAEGRRKMPYSWSTVGDWTLKLSH